MAGKKQEKTEKTQKSIESKNATKSKSAISEREEHILEFWEKNNIFKKTLGKPSPKGEFVFYDGPPFATGEPHYGHLLQGAIKDAVPRFKTMQGYHVPRVWGWDCHGLPIENLVEKELGLKSKKDIEDFGIEKFNDAARESVLRYDAVWKKIVPRTGRWIDMDLAYLTMDWTYSESIWWSFKTLHDKNLIYQGFKPMHICPHDETTLSNLEVGLNYKDITDLSVYVKFELKEEPGTYLLAWTTTPWTLPGNVALAINPNIQYVKVKAGKENLILAEERIALLREKFEVLFKDADIDKAEKLSVKDLLGKKYKPLFNYYENIDLKHKENIWKIVSADFVTTADGTGVVHIAPAFGEDDYNLSLKENLPFIQHVGMDGRFKKEVTDFAGQLVKPKDTLEDPELHQKTDIEIIKFLAKEGSLFAKEKIKHAYPHCWRCDTPLLNYAASSWFVEVTKLKDKLIEENKKVHWVPEEIGEGRFGKWLLGAKDWAISRSRFWGAPLPVWMCKECGMTEILGSLDDIKKRTKRNSYYVFRHGEAEQNIENVLSSKPTNPHHLTEHGIEEVTLSTQALKDKKIDLIIASPFVRTKETADIIREQLGFSGNIIYDDRLGEFNFGDFDGKNIEAYHSYFDSVKEKLTKRLPNGECVNDLRRRIGEFLYDIDSKHENKTIVLVTHDGPATMLFATAEGADSARALEMWGMDTDFLSPGQEEKLDFAQIPHNRLYELDLHRPYIDAVKFKCSCGGMFERVPEVFDTWYESGSMPYGQIHYPFQNKELIEEHKQFPADFIAEGQDQTRGWFYSLLVMSVGLFDQAPYKNVITTGIVLAEDGQKMSKRLKNYPEVTDVLDMYGADALRYYLLSSSVVRAEDLAFSEKGLDEVVKKVLLRLQNVYAFYATYAHEKTHVKNPESKNILDMWILARLNTLGVQVTESLEKYEMDKATRPFGDFVDDLSTWYLRRSRERFKGDDEKDKQAALQTTQYVLFELSKLLAPFLPFISEDIYQKLNILDKKESVHLESWSEFNITDADRLLIPQMDQVRKIVEVGLAVRSKEGIKVRQPLHELKYQVTVKHSEFSKELEELIKDELNVKKVSFEIIADNVPNTYVGMESGGVKVFLDKEITEELKEEGQARELIRTIQDLRKQKKLNPLDSVKLLLEANEEGKRLAEKFKLEIMKVAKLSHISFEKNSGEKIDIDGIIFELEIKV